MVCRSTRPLELRHRACFLIPNLLYSSRTPPAHTRKRLTSRMVWKTSFDRRVGPMKSNYKGALLLLGLAWLSTACSRGNEPTGGAGPISEAEPPGEPEAGIDASFTSEREYPFGSLPEDARRRAWESSYQLRSAVVADDPFWSSIGPARTTCLRSWCMGFEFPTSGRVNSIAISPSNPQIVLIAAGTGGIWRSSDGGATFMPVSDNQIDLAVGSIAFSDSNPSVVYAGNG